MTFDDKFPERVAIHRAGYGYTQAELAEKVGVVPRQIAAYEGGQSKPRPAVLLRMAKLFGVSPDFLAHGGSLYENQAYKGVKVVEHHRPKSLDTNLSGIPLIDVESISRWLRKDTHSSVSVKRVVYHSLQLSEIAFALTIDEPAMASSDSFGYGIPRKSIVIFEPMLDAEDQDFVLVLTAKGDTLFRQFFSGYSGGVLNALDNRYAPESLENLTNEDSDEPMLIPAVSYEAYFPASERLESLYDR